MSSLKAFITSLNLTERGIHVLLYPSKGELAVMLWKTLSELKDKNIRILELDDSPETSICRFAAFASDRIAARHNAEESCKDEDATSDISCAGDGSLWIIFMNGIDKAAEVISGARQLLAAPGGSLIIIPHSSFSDIQIKFPNLSDFWAGQIYDCANMLPPDLSDETIPHPEWRSVMQAVKHLPRRRKI